MAKTSCPYCADPNLFDKLLAPTKGDRLEPAHMLRRGSHWPEPYKIKQTIGQAKIARWGATDPRVVVSLKTPGIIRGRYHINIVTDADMIKRYAGFKVEVIGIECRTEPPAPSGPFLTRMWTVGDSGKPSNFISFNATRTTHKDSPIIVDTHWHQTHGRRVLMRGFSEPVTTPEELAIITTALSFDKQEKKRGAPPKVDRVAVIEAIRAQGKRATQKSVAAAISAAPRTLRDWLYVN